MYFYISRGGNFKLAQSRFFNLAQSTLSALRSSVELSQRKLFIARFEEFAEVNRLGDFMML